MDTIRECLNRQVARVEAVGWTAIEDPNGIINRLHSALLDVSDDAVAAIELLNASAPQCLDNPPHCSHRLVPDPPLTEENNDGV